MTAGHFRGKASQIKSFFRVMSKAWRIQTKSELLKKEKKGIMMSDKLILTGFKQL